MLDIEHVEKTFSSREGEPVRALDRVSLSIPEGCLFTLLGASGSGKTTMLRSIAGLEKPDAGRIAIGDTVVYDGARATFVPPNKRKLGMVFQSYAIWPHMTVFENVAFPLRVKRKGRGEIRSAVMSVLATMQMEHLAERPATLLSGGQQQRLALARATVDNPRLLLLDEPLSNLDAKLRERMRFEIKRLQRDLGITAVYVTHDQAEALALSDEIAVMKDGQVLEQGTPAEVYYRPKSEYVADFIGSTNLLRGTLRTVEGVGRMCGVEVEGHLCAGKLTGLAARGDDVTLAVRPEEIGLTAAKPDEPVGEHALRGTIKSTVFLGESTEFLVGVGPAEVRVRLTGMRSELAIDDAVVLTLRPEACRVLPLAPATKAEAAPPIVATPQQQLAEL